MLAVLAVCSVALLVVAMRGVSWRRAAHTLAHLVQAAAEATQLDRDGPVAWPAYNTASALTPTTGAWDVPQALDHALVAIAPRLPDDGFQTLVEDVPGVGRIEWDAQTLRIFACQPDVLQRLAFHRWRMQQGMLSEFEVASRAGVQKSTGERDEVKRPALQTPQRLAPNSQGLRARLQGQQTTHADQ
jgi:hypothetical protein